LRTEDQLLFPDPRGGVLANKVLNRWYRDLATATVPVTPPAAATP
jgi:hypothetical protein